MMMTQFRLALFAAVMALASPAFAQGDGGSGPGGASGGGGGGGGSAEAHPPDSRGEALLNPAMFPPTIYGAVRARDLSRSMLNPSTPVLTTDLDRSQPSYFERWRSLHHGGGAGGDEE